MGWFYASPNPTQIAAPDYSNMTESEKLIAQKEHQNAQIQSDIQHIESWQASHPGTRFNLATPGSAERLSAEKTIAANNEFLAQAKQANIENIRNVRASVRQARMARSSIVNQGANSGTGGSSGVAGGTASVASQLASNLNFFSQMHSLSAQAQGARLDQAMYQDQLNSIYAQRAASAAKKQASRGRLMQGLGIAATIFAPYAGAAIAAYGATRK